MELFKLNMPSFTPGTTIKNFDSLIWTERYQEAGEFRLVVENNINILIDLPLDTLISHTNTSQVMIVENHHIKRDKNKKLKVTVTGRTFETFAEARTTNLSESALYSGGVFQNTSIYGPSSTPAASIFFTHLCSGGGTLYEPILNVTVDVVVRVPDTSLTHVIQRGEAYARAMEFLKMGGLGIKTVRPTTVAFPWLDIIIHDGLDKKASVVFKAQDEDLEDAEYLWSNRYYRNYAHVAAHDTGRIYQSRDVAVNQSGLNRRIMYVEASDLEGAFSPPTATDAIAGRAQAALDGNKKMAIISARIAPTAKSVYKLHYDIGDLVTVYGEFSLAQTMRVTEHILTVDSNGMRGFPSLSTI